MLAAESSKRTNVQLTKLLNDHLKPLYFLRTVSVISSALTIRAAVNFNKINLDPAFKFGHT